MTPRVLALFFDLQPRGAFRTLERIGRRGGSTEARQMRLGGFLSKELVDPCHDAVEVDALLMALIVCDRRRTGVETTQIVVMKKEGNVLWVHREW